MPTSVHHHLSVASSTLTCTLSGWRGSRVVHATRQPPTPLSLHDKEGRSTCHRVRELLTELELPYPLHKLGKEQFADIGPAAPPVRPGSCRPRTGGKREQFLARLGRVQVPDLEDPNTGATMFESAAIIIDCLEQQYAP